jgi:hypothetical protein
MSKLPYIFVLAFVSNWVWENLHSVLYFHPNGEMITQTILLQATLFDAVFITVVGIVFLLVPYLRERLWLSIIVGMVGAIIIEWQALAIGEWAYTASMPLIPLLNTGLTPTIQLGLLSYLIFKLIKLDKQRESND